MAISQTIVFEIDCGYYCSSWWFTSVPLVLALGHILFKYASRNTINDSTELSLKRPRFSLTITPPAEKCLSDSADEACITKIRLAIIDKTFRFELNILKYTIVLIRLDVFSQPFKWHCITYLSLLFFLCVTQRYR